MVAAVIVDLARTPSGRGKPGGALSSVHPARLLGDLIRVLVDRNGLNGVVIDDVIAGCVSQVGDQAMNVARTAALVAGLPEAVPATTIDRQCGSSQQAVHFAVQAVMAGSYDIAIACGVESMSRVRMGAANAGGDPLGPLADRYPGGLVSQGISAELIAAQWKLDRAELDEYAARSHQRAAAAGSAGDFAREIVPTSTVDGSAALHVVDETVRGATTREGLAGLPAAFRTDELATRYPSIGWHITPGNSSPLTDGASAVLIMSETRARELGLRPRARIRSMVAVGSDPVMMLTGVLPATQKALQRAGLAIGDLDVYEVNEAFAPVPLMWAREFAADSDRLNPRGGAIALGHPLGASGTRLLTTLVHYLEDTDGTFGLQTMCEGGGQANATVIERMS